MPELLERLERAPSNRHGIYVGDHAWCEGDRCDLLAQHPVTLTGVPISSRRIFATAWQTIGAVDTAVRSGRELYAGVSLAPDSKAPRRQAKPDTLQQRRPVAYTPPSLEQDDGASYARGKRDATARPAAHYCFSEIPKSGLMSDATQIGQIRAPGHEK